MLGALPLYPAFLDPPADPSPYLPVSRLAYNEVFVDPTVLPELAAAPEARRLLGDDEFRRQVSSAHGSTLVDYETVAAPAPPGPGSHGRGAAGGGVGAPRCVLRLGRRPPRAAGLRALPGGGRPARPPARHRGAPAPRGPGLRAVPRVPPVRAVGGGAATQRRRRRGPALRRSPHRRPPRRFRPALGARCLRARGARRSATRPLLRRRPGLGVSPLHPERMRDDGYDYFIGVLRRAFRARRLLAGRSHHGPAASVLDP